jgi:SAM-dependent methyltransferase
VAVTEPLPLALGRIRELILDPQALVKAVASGRHRGGVPPWRRVELRYVDLPSGRRLQITRYDTTQAFAANLTPDVAQAAVDELIGLPFGHWNLSTLTEDHALRVTKKLDAAVRTTPRAVPAEVSRDHDRRKERLLAQDDPVLVGLGISDAQGRIKPSRGAKYRQVEEFLRHLDAALTEAISKGHLRSPTVQDPLRMVDLGCGNGYLTFAAARYLGGVRGLPVALTGVDVKEQSREHNSALAAALGPALAAPLRFVAGTIGEAEFAVPPEVVLALHACDTATDDALARAVGWGAPLVLAAPCCHHDIAAQLRKLPPPPPYTMLTRYGIVRERLADTLTDALRAALLRCSGYRVDVVEFVESRHTPRNTLLRAIRTGRPALPDSGESPARAEYLSLVTAWCLEPRLGELLDV